MFGKSLSGRFFMMTIVFVMLAEVLIFVPSLARFRLDYLEDRLERSQIASLAVLASPDEMVETALQKELLQNAGVINVVLKRDEVRQLVLQSPFEGGVAASFDLRDQRSYVLLRGAMQSWFRSDNQIIRVVGTPVNDAGTLIDILMYERPLRLEMTAYGWNILRLSIFLSLMIAALLYLVTHWLMVRPKI